MKKLLFVVALFAACATPPPPVQPVPEIQQPAAAAEAAIGTVRVTATTLNVRKEASASADVVGQVRKGERLTLLAAGDEWMRVRLADGATGWVSAQHVTREGAQSRSRRGCPADADYRFAKAPLPAFSDQATPHGVVAVDANVDRNGNVTSTHVISNTTGDQTLAAMAEREIRDAKFVAPIRRCAPQPFIFSYKRSF